MSSEWSQPYIYTRIHSPPDPLLEGHVRAATFKMDNHQRPITRGTLLNIMCQPDGRGIIVINSDRFPLFSIDTYNKLQS